MAVGGLSPAQAQDFSIDKNLLVPPLEQGGWDVGCMKVPAVPRDRQMSLALVRRVLSGDDESSS